MKNTSTGAGEGSSSNPNTTPNNSPQRPDHAQGGAGNTSSQVSSPVQRSPLAHRPSPPQMGRPGNSAFSPYRPPHWQLQFVGGSSGGIGPSQAVPVDGGAGADQTSGGGVRGGIGNAGTRKRAREGGPEAGQGGGPVQCSICRKPFLTVRALFGHMRSHPDRGWKGAFPPPSFRPEEEFADLPYLNRRPLPLPPAEAPDEELPEVVNPVIPEKAAVGEAREEEGNAAATEGGNGDQEDVPKFRVPDLNNLPPPESDA